MKKTLVLALATTTFLSTGAVAQKITEFRVGILGGENAQDRMNSYQCLADYTTEALGVNTKLFAPADYNGVIQGLLGGIPRTPDQRGRCQNSRAISPVVPRPGKKLARITIFTRTFGGGIAVYLIERERDCRLGRPEPKRRGIPPLGVPPRSG